MGASAVDDDREIAGAATRAGKRAVGQCGFICQRRRLAARGLRQQRGRGERARFLVRVDHDLIADASGERCRLDGLRSEEPTYELQALMRTSSAVFCLKKKKQNTK